MSSPPMSVQHQQQQNQQLEQEQEQQHQQIIQSVGSENLSTYCTNYSKLFLKLFSLF